MGDRVHLRQPVIIAGFHVVMPLHSSEQDASLACLARLHANALGRTDPEEILRLGRRFACGADSIRTRWHEVPELGRAPSPGMPDAPGILGATLSARMRYFDAATQRVLREMYPDSIAAGGSDAGDEAPAELIHVTCTGYVSPSAAQVRVSELGWGARTHVTHAYHMGCHAAIPALRMAAGALALGVPSVDVVHGEICSLHFRPGQIQPEQWVIQSLFADGFVKYRACGASDLRGAAATGPHLELLSVDEILAPGSSDQMTWAPAEVAFEMSLSRTVPAEIARGAGALVDRLLAGIDGPATGTLYAVHPGGPRVLESVSEALRLDDSHLAHSRALLRARGNMSSATLPILWDSILGDRDVADGTLVVTLAFGPGLTLAGAVLRVRRPADRA